jgi:hypothetical protein
MQRGYSVRVFEWWWWGGGGRDGKCMYVARLSKYVTILQWFLELPTEEGDDAAIVATGSGPLITCELLHGNRCFNLIGHTGTP